MELHYRSSLTRFAPLVTLAMESTSSPAASPRSPRLASARTTATSPTRSAIGVKTHVASLERVVEEQHQLIEKLSKQIIEQRREMQTMFKEMSEKWSKAFAESEEEADKKFRAIAAEIQALHKGVTARKGETNLLTQQNKDVNRQVAELAERLDDLRLELLGDQ